MIQKIKNMKHARKAASNMNANISALMTGLIVVVMATALAPDFFSNITSLDNATFNNSSGQIEEVAPDWVPTVMYLTVGAGLVFLVWRVFMKN